jgi:hypothetical protein
VPAISVILHVAGERPQLLWVALRGAPVPLRLSGDDGSDTVELTEHGRPVDVRPPPAAAIVTAAQVEAAGRPPAASAPAGPLTGTVTIRLHGTAVLPKGIRVAFTELADLATIEVSWGCDGSGSLTVGLRPGSSTFTCGVRIELVSVDRTSQPPSVRIAYRPDR